ncbi:MAG: hypothetical protein Q7U52_19025 [Hydrogenophaga sp.]|uniref:hypothetical protein n=1 Tax=Hydrogenophaga sp. TaxID=1904254 RepID=UPI0027215880|nr:hypothetical protein [Hydrogenophaga sp.]MDO9149720.1 hypothetical protein [Hydrogenophaga sp.]MDO9603533.1 hypothetical protein [Hydrogenophaga sp.]
MQTRQDLGDAVAARRKLPSLKRGGVAAQAGVTPASLSRVARGQVAEFGSRKRLAVGAVLGGELGIVAQGQAGHRDELRRERAQPATGRAGGTPGTVTQCARSPGCPSSEATRVKWPRPPARSTEKRQLDRSDGAASASPGGSIGPVAHAPTR